VSRDAQLVLAAAPVVVIGQELSLRVTDPLHVLNEALRRVPERAVMRLMGWSNSAMAARYQQIGSIPVPTPQQAFDAECDVPSDR
jgi:hypothetical protein